MTDIALTTEVTLRRCRPAGDVAARGAPRHDAGESARHSVDGAASRRSWDPVATRHDSAIPVQAERTAAVRRRGRVACEPWTAADVDSWWNRTPTT